MSLPRPLKSTLRSYMAALTLNYLVTDSDNCPVGTPPKLSGSPFIDAPSTVKVVVIGRVLQAGSRPATNPYVVDECPIEITGVILAEKEQSATLTNYLPKDSDSNVCWRAPRFQTWIHCHHL